jgi:hypothetical protein
VLLPSLAGPANIAWSSIESIRSFAAPAFGKLLLGRTIRLDRFAATAGTFSRSRTLPG